MNLDFYFPTPVWWADTPVDVAPIKMLCDRLRDEDPTGRQISNNGGWQSKDFKGDTHNELNQLVDYIVNNSQQCIEDYGFHSDARLEMLNMWLNVNGKGHSNQIHTHGGSFISGTFYVQVPEKSSDIILYKNTTEDHIISSAAHIERYTAISGATCRYPAREGRMVLFPSYVPHGVLPMQGEGERISLAFNLRIVEDVL